VDSKKDLRSEAVITADQICAWHLVCTEGCGSENSPRQTESCLHKMASLIAHLLVDTKPFRDAKFLRSPLVSFMPLFLPALRYVSRFVRVSAGLSLHLFTPFFLQHLGAGWIYSTHISLRKLYGLWFHPTRIFSSYL